MQSPATGNSTRLGRRLVRHGAFFSAAIGVTFAMLPPFTAKVAADDLQEDWGRITAPVFGTSESGAYSGAEFFAGPNKFDNNYFHGVLPSGRIVRPAGISTQIGMNPLGVALTPDGKYLIASNDDERDGNLASLQNPTNQGGYSLSVVDTSTMKVVSQTNVAGRFFIGLQVTGAGPYTVWVSGGPENTVKTFAISNSGIIGATPSASITITPLLAQNQGYVSNYTPDPALPTNSVPTNFSSKGAKTTFPAGSMLSPDGKFLYVACNGDNSLAVIDTAKQKVVKQVAVGYFPYSVAVTPDGGTVYVSNWGITEYKFKFPTYAPGTGLLTALGVLPGNQPDGFYVPVTVKGKTSSVSVVSIPNGDGSQAVASGSVDQSRKLDALNQVGDTHPSAVAVLTKGKELTLYVTRSNDDSIGIVPITDAEDRSSVFNLSPFDFGHREGRHNEGGRHKDRGEGDDNERSGGNLVGTYPNAIVATHDGTRAYVAEAGLNSVAVLDTHNNDAPRLIGRIPTGWYPTGLALSPDEKTLYVINAKGIGEDVNPSTPVPGTNNATGVESFSDSNFIFGSVQKIDLANTPIDNQTVLSYNFARQNLPDSSIVPTGEKPSKKIKHVIFILHENKTFDSMLGSESSHFGVFATNTFNAANGTLAANAQFTTVDPNTRTLADAFATGVNYYSDSEESDAGHQFCASGTVTDYTEKTLLVKSGRGLLVNKNFEPEDYPAGGYIFNNAARNGVSFKDYGALIRITGTDTGTSTPTTIDDPSSGKAGYPAASGDPSTNVGDVNSATTGLGQAYFLAMPVLSVLGGNNPNGEARLDHNYPGYNFNISDQRRALEFIKDFDRMVSQGTLPTYLYIYQPNDHTGGQQSTNVPPATAAQQVGDGDVGLGMVVQHIMSSPVYYNAQSGEGSAIFITYDDAQSTSDHIHQHRTPLIVVSPYAKPGFVAKRHYDTASVVKTEELLLGLPPNNLGDLLATDLRDLFQETYNGITAGSLVFDRIAKYEPSPEGRRIWDLVHKLDTSAPDRDSRRLGALARVSMAADQLHADSAKSDRLKTEDYQERQEKLFQIAQAIVRAGAPRDADD